MDNPNTRNHAEVGIQIGDMVKILIGRYTGMIGEIIEQRPDLNPNFEYVVKVYAHSSNEVPSGEYSAEELKKYTRDGSLMESFRYPNLPVAV